MRRELVKAFCKLELETRGEWRTMIYGKPCCDKVQIFRPSIISESRVWSLHRDYCQCLRTARYAYILVQKPHIDIRHILQKLKQAQLKDRLKSIIEWREDDKFDTGRFQDLWENWSTRPESHRKKIPSFMIQLNRKGITPTKEGEHQKQLNLHEWCIEVIWQILCTKEAIPV